MDTFESLPKKHLVRAAFEGPMLHKIDNSICISIPSVNSSEKRKVNSSHQERWRLSQVFDNTPQPEGGSALWYRPLFVPLQTGS